MSHKVGHEGYEVTRMWTNEVSSPQRNSKSTQRIIVSRVQNSKEPQSKHVPFVNLLNSFSPDLVNEIVQLSRRMNSSIPETIEMTLRNAFCLRVPQKWMRDSWVQGGVVFEGDWNGELNSFRCWEPFGLCGDGVCLGGVFLGIMGGDDLIHTLLLWMILLWILGRYIPFN